MSQEQRKSYFPHPDENTSTTDFIALCAQSSVEQMDLVTKAPKEAVVAKAKKIKASEISGAGENLTEYYPGIDDMFAREFSMTLEINVAGDDVDATKLLRAYESAVHVIRGKTTKQFSHMMLMPGAVGDFFDYFDVPVSSDIVSDLETDNPDLADEYKERAKRWMEGV